MTDNHKPGDVLGSITGIECEAVVGGALQRITFQAGTNPAEVAAMLRALDPAATVRTEFPTRGSFGGKRDSKLARALVVQVEPKGDARYIKVACVAPEGDDIPVSVGKKRVEEFLPSIEKLGKLTEKHLASIRTAMAGGKAAMVILGEDEHFGVSYWTTDDGAAFWEGCQPEAPGEAA